MFSHTRNVVGRAESLAQSGGSLSSVLPVLRELCLDDFGELMLRMPDSEWPGLSRLLPRMASPVVQRQWTGSDGHALLRQTLNFVRVAAQGYYSICGRGPEGLNVLDFGCGYGRILRLMYYYSDPDRLFGCDAWDRSIAICRDDRVHANLAVSDYLPVSLPFPDRKFDWVYCFSVFTHLSSRAARAALHVLREYVADEGLLVFTIRPVEYWRFDKQIPPETAEQLTRQHHRDGFAFKPHDLPPVDGDVTYGDTSMTFSYLKEQFPRWRFVKYDRTLDDPYQLIVFMCPR